MDVLLEGALSTNSSTDCWSLKKRWPCSGSLTLFPADFLHGNPKSASIERIRLPASYMVNIPFTLILTVNKYNAQPWDMLDTRFPCQVLCRGSSSVEVPP